MFYNLDYIVIGLGNIGSKYNLTRHNMGFMVLDQFSKDMGFIFNKTRFNSSIAKVNLLNKKILFMKPLTYMNNSGLALVDALKFYKLPTSNVIILHDDITINLGKIKIKQSGSAGGHNGLNNIIELTGARDFIRIKIGISAKPDKNLSLADWVLSRFNETEQPDLIHTINLACDALKVIITNGAKVAMSQFNRSITP